MHVGLVADVASVRREAFVAVQMINQVLAHRECFMANVAQMRFVVVVSLQMADEITQLGVRFVTILTSDGFHIQLCFVLPHVILELVFVS